MSTTKLVALASAISLTLIIGGASIAQARVTKGRLTLTAANFYPMQDGIAYTNQGNFLQGAGHFIAPLAIPPGATITKLRAFAVNDDAQAPITLLLVRDNPSIGEEVTIGGITVNGASPDLRTFASRIVVEPTLESQVFYLYAGFPAEAPSHQLYGAEISYTLP